MNIEMTEELANCLRRYRLRKLLLKGQVTRNTFCGLCLRRIRTKSRQRNFQGTIEMKTMNQLLEDCGLDNFDLPLKKVHTLCRARFHNNVTSFMKKKHKISDGSVADLPTENGIIQKEKTNEDSKESEMEFDLNETEMEDEPNWRRNEMDDVNLSNNKMSRSDDEIGNLSKWQDLPWRTLPGHINVHSNQVVQWK